MNVNAKKWIILFFIWFLASAILSNPNWKYANSIAVNVSIEAITSILLVVFYLVYKKAVRKELPRDVIRTFLARYIYSIADESTNPILYSKIAIILFLFLISAESFFTFNYLSNTLQIINLILTSAFLFIITLFIIKDYETPNYFLLIIFTILFLCNFLFYTSFAIDSTIQELAIFFTYYILFLPVLFLLFIGGYLIKVEHNYAKGTILLISVIILVWFIFLSGLVFTGYQINDEELLTFLSIKSVVHGQNPYNASFGQQLYSNFTKVGATITTNGDFVTKMDYPSLYFLSFFPFYYLSSPTFQNIGSIDLEWQALFFVPILLFIIIFLIDKEKFKLMPIVGLIIFIIFEASAVASVNTFLMLALILLAYAKLESKYSWVFLGIAISFQEQLWIPVTFLLLYSFNNAGVKKGLQNLIGMSIIFLLANLPFILMNPTIYFQSLFFPINKLIFPNPVAPFGYFILTNYPILLSSFNLIFAIILIMMLLLFFLLNKKELIPIFSMIPLMFLQKSLIVYYPFFIAFFIITLFVKREIQKTESISNLLRYFLPSYYWLIIFGIISSIFVITIITSHLQLSKEFNISISNQSLIINNTERTTTYYATLNYANLSNNTVYLLMFGYYNSTLSLYGIANQSLLNNLPPCGNNYRCLINPNKIVLNSTSNSYQIKATIPWNGTFSANKPIYVVKAVIYNGRDFLTFPEVRN